MWSTAISIDKRYGREFAYILGEVKKNKYSSCAVEESRFRYFVQVVSEEKYRAAVVRDVIRIVADVILIYFKARYLKKRLTDGRGGDDAGTVGDAMAILISSLIYFDVGIESRILNGIITDSDEYSVDGLFMFRMGELIYNWDELCALSAGLLSLNPSDSDILNLTSFLIDASKGKKNKITVSGADEISVFNVTTNEKIYIHDIFSDEKQNLTNAIISCYPEEICLKNKNLSERVLNVLKKIVKIQAAEI
ncbi:MAG: hypothetical protein LBP79_05105 [Clostridiales bacterium]|nr:hypothetical protein [Clostridiales bacterium]